MNKTMLQGKKVAILVAEGFEQVELTAPRQALDEAGAETRIVSPAKGQVQGWNHFDKGDKFTVDVALDQAKPQEFDALLLPGGVANPDQLRINAEGGRLHPPLLHGGQTRRGHLSRALAAHRCRGRPRTGR